MRNRITKRMRNFLISFFLLRSFTIIIQAEVYSSVPTRAYYLQLYNFINGYRAKHLATSLRWNRSLNERAEYLAQQILLYPDSFDPSELEYHGINTYRTAGNEKPSSELVVATWYNESRFYDFSTPGYNSKSLNFTQMVWRSSSTIGFGVVSLNNSTIVIADFDPDGNIKGKFKVNVIPKGTFLLG